MKHRVVANLARVAVGQHVDLSVALEGADDSDVVGIECHLVEPMAGGLEIDSCDPNPYELHHVRVRLIAVERCKGGKQGLLLTILREQDQVAAGPGDDDDDDDDGDPDDDDDDEGDPDDDDDDDD